MDHSQSFNLRKPPVIIDLTAEDNDEQSSQQYLLPVCRVVRSSVIEGVHHSTQSPHTIEGHRGTSGSDHGTTIKSDHSSPQQFPMESLVQHPQTFYDSEDRNRIMEVGFILNKEDQELYHHHASNVQYAAPHQGHYAQTPITQPDSESSGIVHTSGIRALDLLLQTCNPTALAIGSPSYAGSNNNQGHSISPATHDHSSVHRDTQGVSSPQIHSGLPAHVPFDSNGSLPPGTSTSRTRSSIDQHSQRHSQSAQTASSHAESSPSDSDDDTSSSESRGPSTLEALIAFTDGMQKLIAEDFNFLSKLNNPNPEPSTVSHAPQDSDQNREISHNQRSGSPAQHGSTKDSTHSSDDKNRNSRRTSPPHQHGAKSTKHLTSRDHPRRPGLFDHLPTEPDQFDPEGSPDISGSHLPLMYESIERDNIEEDDAEEAWTTHCEQTFAAADAAAAANAAEAAHFVQTAQNSGTSSSRVSPLKRACPSSRDPDQDFDQPLYRNPLKAMKECSVPFGMNVPVHAVPSHQATIHAPAATHHDNSRAASFINVNTTNIHPGHSNHSSFGSTNSSPVHGFEDSDNSYGTPDHTVRRSKDLFGHKGILSRDSESHHTDKRARRTETFGKRTIVSSLSNLTARLTVEPAAIVTKTTAPISLSRSIQACLESRLEELITLTANEFLMGEYYEGNISESSISRVRKFWGKHVGPGVPEFAFDQKTQYELIYSNREKLSFGDSHTKLPVMSILGNWKALYKEMAIRTFNKPDVVIKKHLVDGYAVMGLLKASPSHLNEIATLHAIILDKLASLHGEY